MKTKKIKCDSFDWDEVAEFLFQISLDGSKIHKDNLDEHTESTLEAMSDTVRDLLFDYKKLKSL